MRPAGWCALLLLLRADGNSTTASLGGRADVRCDLCNRTRAVTAGELAIEDALRGARLTFIAAEYDGNAMFYTVDAATGIASGMHVELMELVAARAGFAYTIERITPAEFGGLTWGEYLRSSASLYDANLDWWWQTAARSALGLRSPLGFLDMSLVASAYDRTADGLTWAQFWSFAAPFDAALWALIAASTALTSVIYLALEQKHNQVDVRPGADLSERVGNILYLGYAQFTGGGGFAPETGWGKGLLLSYSFVVLLLVAAYTANLATFLLRAATSELGSLRAAVERGVRVCVFAGTAAEEWLAGAYPDADVAPGADGAWAGLARGACGVALGGRLNFELALRSAAANADCALAQVGANSERIFTAGWMVGVDYSFRCSSLIVDVLGYWLLVLENDGVLGEKLAQMKALVASQTCEADDYTTDAIDVREMGGVFILHGAICCACCAGYCAHQWHLRRSRVGALDEGEELDDRPATKTDVAHMSEKFAHLNERFDEHLEEVLRALAAGVPLSEAPKNGDVRAASAAPSRL